MVAGFTAIDFTGKVPTNSLYSKSLGRLAHTCIHTHIPYHHIFHHLQLYLP